MTRSLLALAASALLAVACSGSDPTGSRSAMCDPDQEDCAQAPSSHKPSTSSPTPTEDPGTATADPTPPVQTHQAAADAGADAAPDAAPDTSTTFCQDLAACCAQLKAEGYDNSMCTSVVSKKDQVACLQKLASYQSFGDCKQN